MCLMDERKTDIDADFDAELVSYLSSCEGAGSYRVLETLKSSDFEVTEKVVFCGRDGGELGPFVRKRIDAACGLGHAYERLMAAATIVVLPMILLFICFRKQIVTGVSRGGLKG